MKAVGNQTKFWLKFALISASLPLFFLALLSLFPALRQHPYFEYHLQLGPRPFQGLPRTMVECVSLFYWSAGISTSVILYPIDTPGWRAFVSDFLHISTIVVLLYILPLLSVTWVLAFDKGAIPSGQWGVNEGNHGPWYFYYQLSLILGETLLVPLPATALALLSFVLKPSWRSILTVVASGFALFFLIYVFQWLID